MYAGDYPLESTIDVKFSTVDDTGLPTTLAGSPVVSAYVGNGTTEITAGITLSVDFDSRTGLHNVRVAATAANGYADQTQVTLVITTGTVDGVSVVGYVVGRFTIGMLTLGDYAGLIPLAVKTGAVVDDASNSATTFKTDLSETDDHFWKDSFLLITSGALVGQQKRIIAYDGTTKFITVLGGFTAKPAAGSTFAIVNR